MAENSPETILDRVAHIKELINEAAKKAGTKRVILLAAAKTKGPEEVREAIKAGVDAVGENRVQEMLEKLSVNAYEGAPLHFIGNLQTNKVRQVVGKVGLIESVGSLSLVRAIDLRAESIGIIQDILLQINIGKEETKGGFLIEDYEKGLEEIAGLKSVRVKGLMAIPPPTTIYCDSKRFFFQMYQLFIDTEVKRYDNIFMETLSMGMSDDYLTAIEAGSNLVRIGSLIFGKRLLFP